MSTSRPKKPTFSVCIPNYNYANYIEETIRSALDQSYPPYEIIVADNSSTDHSVEVVRSIKSKKIKLVTNRYNVGFSPNLDRATEGATGDFMILLSSDDVMRPDALKTYAAVLQGLGGDAGRTVLTSAVDVIDGDSSLTGVSWRPPGELFYRMLSADQAAAIDWSSLKVEHVSGAKALAASLRRKDSPAAFLATCYSRELYQQAEGYHNPYRIWPDGHFLNKLLSFDPVFAYVPTRLFGYRVHDNNQLAGEAHAGALKYQVDAYMHTVEFPQDVLDRLGVRREDLAQVFIERGVVDRGLQAMAAKNPLRAFKTLAFGLASYPDQMVRQPKSYALAGLIAMGPVGTRLAGWLYKRHLARKEP